MNDFVLILNPDVILEASTINELIIASQKILDFGILAPISSDTNYPNYKLFNSEKIQIEVKTSLKVKSVDGFAMLFNKKKLDKIILNDYFDENFFMYLENDDLCKRINQINKIYIVLNSRSCRIHCLMKNIKMKLSFLEIGIGFGLNFILIKNTMVTQKHF